MWIKKAVFKNFGPHEFLELKFTQGLVGIFGANGQGKSMAVDGIYAALTNDWSRFAGVKTDNIRDTAGEKEESSVYIEAEHDSVGFSLLRSLRPNKAELLIEGKSEGIRKAGEIQHELEHNLGVDTKLIGTYAFVEQWSMFEFLSQTPGDRARTYQHLCDTGKAEVIYNAVNKMLSEEQFQTSVVDTTDEIRAQLSQREIKAKEVQAEMKEVNAKLRSDDDISTAKRTLAKREEHDRSLDRKELVEAGIPALEKKVKKAETTAELKAALVKDLDAGIEVVKPAAEASKVSLVKLEQHAKNQKRLGELHDRVLELEDPEEVKLHSDDKKHDDLVKQEAKMLQAEQAIQEKIDDLGADKITRNFDVTLESHEVLGRCFRVEEGGEDVAFDLDDNGLRDTFFSVAQDMDESFEDPEIGEKLQDQFDKAFKEREPVRKLLKLIRTTRSRREEWERKVDWNKTKRESLKEQMDSIEAVSGAGGLVKADLQQTVKDLEELEEGLSNAKEAHATARETLATQSTELKGRQDRLREINATIKENKVSNSAVTGATKWTDEQTMHELILVKLNERIDNLDTEIENDKKQLAKLEAQLARQRKVVKFGNKLRKILKVFHRQMLPQIVAQENLEDMDQDINDVLETFGDPFWVEATEDLSFLVHFPGEPPRPADRLSGGQKGVLAVAFRSAVSSLFGDEIGMMCLDEPTAGMDDRNVSCLSEALNKFAAQVRGKRQVIMITHADALRPSFDQVIDIGVAA